MSAAQWERLADEAIADAREWKIRARNAEDNARELLAVLLDLRAAILDGRHDDARGIAAGDVLTDAIAKATGGAA